MSGLIATGGKPGVAGQAIAGAEAWQPGPGASLSSDFGQFHLTVEHTHGWVRYQVFYRPRRNTEALVLLASGNKDTVQAAMDAADWAARLAACADRPAHRAAA